MTTHCVFLLLMQLVVTLTALQLLTSANQPEILCICMFMLF